MTLQTILPPLLLLIGCLVFIFRPAERKNSIPVPEKTRIDYLHERKDVIYENLRDLNFEFRAGKFPEDDYGRQREELEQEAAKVLAEIEVLGG